VVNPGVGKGVVVDPVVADCCIAVAKVDIWNVVEDEDEEA